MYVAVYVAPPLPVVQTVKFSPLYVVGDIVKSTSGFTGSTVNVIDSPTFKTPVVFASE